MERAKRGIGNWLLDWLNTTYTPPRYPLFDFGRICREIKPCDVLLIESNTRIGRQIQHITNSPWSHACLYLGRLQNIENPSIRQMIAKHYDGSPEDQLVFESNIGEGAVVSSIERYRDHYIRICRPKGLLNSDAQKVITYCVNALGKPYSVRQIFDLLRFLLPWNFLPKTWGSSLFQLKSNESREICSSLLAKAFMSVQFPLIPMVQMVENGEIRIYQRNPKLFTPKDFDYSPYFEIIKFPMLAFGSVPWASEATHIFKNDDGQEVIVQNEN